ncbi:urocortin [Amblyraja radiata]|uniref:urocortin n=1 Tax=Amblyraja radiata TaxID=386614 RepID=UPI001402BBD9|nr:urocortin [Amblyraja radiata]
MTSTPLVFIATCCLLVTHISLATCRAADLSIVNRLGSNASTDTDEENDQFLSYILREKLLQLLEQNPNNMQIQSPVSLDQILNEILDKEANRLLQELIPSTETLASTQEAGHDMVPAFAERSKRSAEPVNSLDLTFHLLREMIKMANNDKQRVQAEKNRKIMDTIGK